MSILSAYAKGLGQLSDPRARSVVWLGVGLAVVVFILLWLSVAWLVTGTTLFQNSWLDGASDVLGGFAVLALTWFLFPVVVSAFIGLFLDRVAAAVEQRHYPGLPAPRNTPILETVFTTVRLLVIMVALNLVVLLFLLLPPVFPFVYYGVNGYLLGREYFETVAARRVKPATVKRLRRQNRGDLFLAGLVLAFLLTVPIVNLLAPVIGTAAMVHLFESRRDRESETGPSDPLGRATA